MILFYLLILSLPMVDHPQFGYAIYGVTVEKFLGVACFFFALCSLPSRKLFPPFLATAQARIFVAFTAMAVGSYVLMVTPFDWHAMVGNIFTELIFFIAASILIDSRQRLENSILVLVASIGLASLYLIKEWAVAVPVYGLFYRPGSVAGDPNVFSASAVTVLPIMVAFTFGGNGWKRVFCGLCLLLTMFAILLASSRGAFIALVVLLLLQMRDARHRGKFIVIAIVIVALFMASPISPLDRLLHPTQGDIDSSNIRLELWSIGFRIVADHPVFGVGLWQFAPYMRKYMPAGVDLEFNVPHNTYLQVAVELGLVGLALFLAMFFFTLLNLSRLRKAARRSGDALMYSLSTAIGNGLVGFGIAVLFLSALHARVFWFSIFLSTCLPPLFARTPAKKPDSDGKETPAEAREAETIAMADQKAAVVESTQDKQSPARLADDVDLRVDQLRIH